MNIRSARREDDEAIWRIMEPTVRAGETYTLPSDMSREAALSYWFAPSHEVFVAEDAEGVLGTYYMRRNQQGGGAHVANCGYMTSMSAMGRGVARTMCEHSLAHARGRGFLAMQFNFVISTNERAVSLWRRLGFPGIGPLRRGKGTEVEHALDVLQTFLQYQERRENKGGPKWACSNSPVICSG